MHHLKTLPLHISLAIMQHPFLSHLKDKASASQTSEHQAVKRIPLKKVQL